MMSTMLASLRRLRNLTGRVAIGSFHCAICFLILQAASSAQSPGGSNGDVQINNFGTFGADTGNFNYTTSTHLLSIVNQLTTGNSTLNGVFFQSAANAGVTHQVDAFSSVPSDSFGNSSNTGILLTPRSWGVGKNVGNPTGFGNAAGWRVLLGMDVESFGGSSGIHQGIHVNPFH